MSSEMRTGTCPNCQQTQAVPFSAAYYQCRSCQSTVAFVNCRCGAQNTVLMEGKRLPPAFTCFNCGQTYPIQSYAAGQRLQAVGKTISNIGKFVTYVGLLILLGSFIYCVAQTDLI
jgi:hypothetical protein